MAAMIMGHAAARASRKRIRAHSNPLSDNDFVYPLTPESHDWSPYYPEFFPPKDGVEREVKILDLGCGFGGLLEGLSPLFPDKLILGLEIRRQVTELVKDRIAKLRKNNQPEEPKEGQVAPYSNISVECTNGMKYLPNFFRKGQLEKLFILFPDPHFKKSNFRRRIVNPSFNAVYAYILQPGGLLYTITDVPDLHEWMVKHLTAHPLFERVPDEDLKDDPCVRVMTEETDEGKKVARLKGSKYPAVFRRL